MSGNVKLDPSVLKLQAIAPERAGRTYRGHRERALVMKVAGRSDDTSSEFR